MLAWLNYHRKLWLLQRERRRLSTKHDRRFRDAKAKNAADKEWELLLHELWEDIGIIDEEIKTLRGLYLITVAERLLLPTPAYSVDETDMWEKSSITNKKLLTREAQYQILSDIRKERSQRSENLRLWLAGATGLIGAMSGLMAILLRH
jgi:hypothetical protein